MPAHHFPLYWPYKIFDRINLFFGATLVALDLMLLRKRKIKSNHLKHNFFLWNFQKSDSEKYYIIFNIFVYEAIQATDSSKCSYLEVLKAYTNRILCL